MLQIVFLLTYVSVSIGIFLMHVDQFLLLLNHLLDSPAKLPIGHRQSHHSSLGHLAVALIRLRMSISGQILIHNILNSTQP